MPDRSQIWGPCAPEAIDAGRRGPGLSPGLVCVKWDDGTDGDYFPRGLALDIYQDIDWSKIPRAHLVIPHIDFDSSLLTRDARGCFIDGYGILDVVGSTEEGVVLEYYDHCGDGKLLPEFNTRKSTNRSRTDGHDH